MMRMELHYLKKIIYVLRVCNVKSSHTDGEREREEISSKVTATKWQFSKVQKTTTTTNGIQVYRDLVMRRAVMYTTNTIHNDSNKMYD